MRLVRLLSIACIAGSVLLAGSASAQGDADPIVVIEVSGALDQRLMGYVIDAIDDEPAHAYVLEIDSPGASSGDLTPLFEALEEAPAPVISWIGPDPARAFGGAAFLANHGDIRSAAPGVEFGYLDPAVQRGDDEPPSLRPGDDEAAVAAVVDGYADTTATLGEDTGTLPGFVDRLDPALGPLIISLDGTTVTRGSQVFELSTAETSTVDDELVLVQSRPVIFLKPGLLDRFLRLASSPETAFLFLVFGLAFAVFEFYAAGSGLMAFVASLSLVLAGYGLATLPVWWPAVALTLAGIGVMVWGFALNRVDWRAVLGTIMLLAGGLTFTTTRPQYPPATWTVVLATAATGVFIWYALTTVVRGRFATPTVGRSELLGRRCLVVERLDPTGVVVVDGARWRATADRGVEIAAGAPAEIVGVAGLVLEVDPVAVPPPRRE